MKEINKLHVRSALMYSFILGSLITGVAIGIGAIQVGYDAYSFYTETGVIPKGTLAIVPIMILMGLFIPGFVVPLAKRALFSIREEKEILINQGNKGLEKFRKENENIYPKRFGFNK